jgi:GTP-binding protein
MIIHTAAFVKSSSEISQCPDADRAEFAFIGRSNVGKSSLINKLTGFGKLAKTSATPGKTQLINHFIINDQWYLVDLPGYGFAKSSKVQREKWQKMIHNYLFKRENLMNTFILIDSRLEPQKIDLEMISLYGKMQLPFTLVFTKIDKVGTATLSQNINNYKKTLLKEWEELPPMILTSAEKGNGMDELLMLIQSELEIFAKHLAPAKKHK